MDLLAGPHLVAGYTAKFNSGLTMADILLFGFMGTASGEIPWRNVPQRPNVAAWFDRMGAREASRKMMTPLQTRVEN